MLVRVGSIHQRALEGAADPSFVADRVQFATSGARISAVCYRQVITVAVP